MEKFIVNTIEIQATPEVVWDALVNPEKTKIYMFGCSTVSDWQEGSALLWQGKYEGKEMVFVKGFIIKIEAPYLLVYSVFDPNSTMEDVVSNYLHVTYKLAANGNTTLLTVTQGDYTTVADGERRYNESYNNGEGWNPILQAIKQLVEQA
ncbi:MAG TPA: SRPBCC domain-containing protein [Chitinophagales bacterium]|nr:SRPBCC domain-containing protein [Chitinophagales bacterium]HRG86799.1 SRPBCC domain-containing protein [Chitinophagales bacterium]HRH54353.1 SRPBCC domain-containing protein [Chitinophagales bacterium]